MPEFCSSRRSPIALWLRGTCRLHGSSWRSFLISRSRLPERRNHRLSRQQRSHSHRSRPVRPRARNRRKQGSNSPAFHHNNSIKSNHMTRMNHATLKKRAALLLGFSAIVAINACSKRDNASAAETATTQRMVVGAENITVATNGSIIHGPSISGTLKPEREAAIRSQVAGSVLQTYADQGQAVSTGAVLARIDASGIQDAYTSARAA